MKPVFHRHSFILFIKAAGPQETKLRTDDLSGPDGSSMKHHD